MYDYYINAYTVKENKTMYFYKGTFQTDETQK